MNDSPDALILFSGGLDSILAARVLAAQGLDVLCLHFTSPFFGNAASIPRWRKIYGLNIRVIDISREFTAMLAAWPPHGPGKTLNPCLDCKILMLKIADEERKAAGAKFVATGEVLGQRPMSQRTDSLNIIARDSGLGDNLLRPLSAAFLKQSNPERTGLVQREKLPAICGRGRNEQLKMAEALGLGEIPSPGGGCRLTERENARRYWPLLKRCWRGQVAPEALAADFRLSDCGRVLFHEDAWLCIGRNKKSNELIASHRRKGDILLRLPFPGPLGLLRGAPRNSGLVAEAAAITRNFSPKARDIPGPLAMRASGDDFNEAITASAAMPDVWRLPDWSEVREEIREERKRRM